MGKRCRGRRKVNNSILRKEDTCLRKRYKDNVNGSVLEILWRIKIKRMMEVKGLSFLQNLSRFIGKQESLSTNVC
jgi:hypothetical protein